MVRMKTKVNIDDFLVIMYWVRTSYMFDGKPFRYEQLFMQAETYKYNNTPIDIKIHKIDDLMVDASKLYVKLKSTEDQVFEILESMPTVDIDEMTSEMHKYEKIFEDLMENYKFEHPEIRGIQKGVLVEKMAEYVSDEEYEKAAKVRDMIKEC